MQQFWHMQIHPNDLSWKKEKEALEKGFIGLGDWDEGRAQQTQFEHEMKENDVVLIRRGDTILALVEIAGPYTYTSTTDDLLWFQRRRMIKVLDWYDRSYGYNIVFPRGTLMKCKDLTKPTNRVVADWFTRVQQRRNQMLERLNALLKASYNIILTGAPGTGKTYLARQIAQKLVFGEGWTQQNEANFTEEERRQFDNRVGFVQFHPSYDYTDFVEGLRPTPAGANGHIGFERKDGVFKAFCKRALQNLENGFDDAWTRFVSIYRDYALELETPSQKKRFIARVNGNDSFSCKSKDAESDQEQSVTKEDVKTWISNGSANWPSYTPPLANYFKERFLARPFVFIVDEINRGEISKIFGELFFSVDPGYRGAKGKVRTQYANLIRADDLFNDGFFVPENVYIVGTMNDIDRSVESLDFAMRRRFVFKEITADESAVSMNLPEKLKSRMASLNTVISGIPGLGSSYHIGAAYFLKDGEPVDDLGELWDLRLEPLLKEYLRGTPDVEGNIGKLKAAFQPGPAA